MFHSFEEAWGYADPNSSFGAENDVVFCCKMNGSIGNAEESKSWCFCAFVAYLWKEFGGKALH